MYTMNLLGNGTMISVIAGNSHLHTPMYFFLCNLSLVDMCFSSVTVPKLLNNLISDSRTISFSNCIAQLYFFVVFGGSECVIMSIMAYDRYVAICNPLHYVTIMNKKVCLSMSIASWITVVTLFYGTLIFMYFRPSSSYSMAKDRISSVVYNVLSPMLNPFIYSLRNRDVKTALKRVLQRK
uniref:Olfactory receptor 1361-like n=1 Tax=Geotrypetes seraphini TaxID=260995 RepID=A0A6P8SHS7_GEOSA|nr:olfactory receptor 1361-like [Geotrypetes seraphini]